VGGRSKIRLTPGWVELDFSQDYFPNSRERCFILLIRSPWGTFELIWTECNGVQFSYNSTVPGYGSAPQQFIRLSTLWNTSCPAF
jgi:hypothetical protein